MAHKSFTPDAYAHLVDLASEAVGGFALHANDDFFAEKENLLKTSAPVFIDDKYTDKGKWMDGWESQRRRDPYADGAHDWCVIRLGLPGVIEGFLVDTTHFKGNAPSSVMLEGLEAEPHLSRADIVSSTSWRTLVSRVDVKPDTPNVVAVDAAAIGARTTHLRLRIYPDGGVARLRAYGVVKAASRTFWGAGSIDLISVENGGTIALASNAFFGPPSNLLLPGRGTNMGDGWETARRRTPGTDWCVIRLGRRGTIDRIELDTHFFKGNAPHAAPNSFFAEGFVNNTCILTAAGDTYLDIGDCAADATLANRVLLGNNRIMSPGGTAAPVNCGKTYAFADWIALGLDVGTTLSDVPATADIIKMGRAVLNMA